jgi:hypothetical protein
MPLVLGSDSHDDERSWVVTAARAIALVAALLCLSPIPEAFAQSCLPVSLASFGLVGSGDDDTAVFQAALNAASGQSWTLYVPVPPSSPYLVNSLFVKSNTKVEFAPGVVIQARPGYGGDDCLLTMRNVKNVTISGYGATLQMPKAEYTSGEMRHALSIRGSSDVVVRGLACNSSGGDGLYIGEGSPNNYCKNVLIQDVTCDNNRRQGMSIISAENLLVQRCQFTNTNGTAPQDGIDIEPNHATNRLVNVRIEDCVTANNHGNGIEIPLGNLDGTSQPVSITVSRHLDRRSGLNGCYITGAGRANPVTGTVSFTNFTSQSPQGEGVYIFGCGGPSLSFSDLTITNPAQKGLPSYDSAIFIHQPSGASNPGGNVFIRSSTISDSTGKMYYYFEVRDSSGLGYRHLQIAHDKWSRALYDPHGLYQRAPAASVDVR